MQEVAPVEMHLGIHFLSLFILVANIALLLLLFRLLTVTGRFSNMEAESLTTAGLTFKSSHDTQKCELRLTVLEDNFGATISFRFLLSYFWQHYG